jgi:hypothetical protein
MARTTYVRLHRLERQGLLASEWRPVPGRTIMSKYYWVTERGVHRLEPSRATSGPAIHPWAALLLIAIAGPGEGASRSDQARLTIVVKTSAAISSDELRRVGMDVIRILGAIGVTTDWVTQPENSWTVQGGVPQPAQNFVINATIVAAQPGPSRSEEALLGQTPPGPHANGGDILVFYQRILEVAQLQQKATSSVLAIVLAHEIGHVLLPAPAHASAGIMQAPWDQRALDRAATHQLLFTSSQGALIRERLQQCCGIVATR